ncbi:nitrate- and nitrite sensing domain-containing protein [Nocardiopsis sp. YSL2]|uniref:nitrate- and nitrite sensing domain-containing protein n=1 Tax=Nocardiopsis sp. YSL2 TaxID=2939492 RepID=UPI0026F4365F|nr:nitrate- and nitrite sensing domain-containing protein [Nocardiopsis sp. YSL2]
MQAAPERRRRTITARLRTMVMIPVAALIALWLILTVALAGNAVIQIIQAKATEDMIAPAAVGLVNVMQERSQTIAYIENPQDRTLQQELAESRTRSDESMGAVIDDLFEFVDLAPDGTAARISELHSQYSDIGGIREAVDEGSASRSDVLTYYNSLIVAGSDTFDTQTREGTEGSAVSPAYTATTLFRAVDLFAQSDAQLARAFATEELGHEDQHEFGRLVGSYQGFLDASAPYLEGEGQQERVTALLDSPEYSRLLDMQQQIIHRQIETETVTDPLTFQAETVQDLSLPVDADQWSADYSYVLSELTDIGSDEALYAASLTREDANRAVLTAVLGSLGVAAVTGLAFLLATRSARLLTARLLDLRDGATDLAETRLPALMRRLHEGDSVDTHTAVPQLTTTDDEIGDVARAFNTAQRAAVDEAVQQTELRQGVNRVFLNIAHRSQTLVHRQLRLLDKMEREQEDPDQLAQLFKLDHLATRSRRNAENLLILGGEAPGRTWHRPMPLIDVLRGAISESGDYTRVKRERIARVHLNGPAVADVIHLVAELVDNAAMFSPPHTQVRLSSDDVPNGVTVEIEDRGLGMTEGEFESANALLADPPEFDVMRLNEKMRLGLFVVSHLAHRHGIQVHLRQSPYGGVQAIVLLPHSLISGERRPVPGQDGDEDIWEVREIVGRSRDAIEAPSNSGNGTKPVLTSVAPPTDVTDETEAADGTGNTADGSASPATGLASLFSAAPAPAAVPDGDTRGDGAGDRDDASGTGGRSGDVGTEDRPGAPGGTTDGANGTGPLPRRTPAPGGGPAPSGAEARPPLPTRRSAADTATPPSEPASDRAQTMVEAGGGRPPLPKRRPQENLAPQLATDHDGDVLGGPAAGGTPSGDPTVSSDRLARLRQNMSAFQKGTDRGRRESKQQTDDTDKDA